MSWFLLGLGLSAVLLLMIALRALAKRSRAGRDNSGGDYSYLDSSRDFTPADEPIDRDRD